MYSSYRWDKFGKIDGALLSLGINSMSMISEGGSTPRTMISYTDGTEEILEGEEGEKKSAEIMREIDRIKRGEKINRILKDGS